MDSATVSSQNSICTDKCITYKKVGYHFLKVPKHENFSIAFFALSEPIWVCDVGTAKKIEFFYRLTPDFNGFGFFAAY